MPRLNRYTMRILTTLAALLPLLPALHGCSEDQPAAATQGTQAGAPSGAPSRGSVANTPEIIPGQDGRPDRMRIDRFVFAPPQGWSSRGVRDVEVLRIFEKGDTADPDARITLFRRRAQNPDADAVLREYVAEWGGEIQDDHFSLGRTDAQLSSRAHPGDGLQVVYAVFCRWYVEDIIIQGEAKPGEDVRQPILEVAESWRWLGGTGG